MQFNDEQFNSIVLSWAYEDFGIYECVHCQHPVKEIMCCGFCGSESPKDINDKSNWKDRNDKE